MKNLIFFGPPGAGKGTQAKIISKIFNIPHLSTGDILRDKIEKKDTLALKVKQIISEGKLVSDDILNSIVLDKLQKEKNRGFILDGYPRTLDQSMFLSNFLRENLMSIDFIFNIEINFELLKERIIKRSGEENRDDDNLEVIQTRYDEYTKTTKKVSDYYKSNLPKLFYEIDGNQQIEEITSKIKKILQNSWISAKISYFCTWLKQYSSCIHLSLFNISIWQEFQA